MKNTGAPIFRSGDKVVYIVDVGDIAKGDTAAIVDVYGAGNYLVQVASGRKYYAHDGEIKPA